MDAGTCCQLGWGGSATQSHIRWPSVIAQQPRSTTHCLQSG